LYIYLKNDLEPMMFTHKEFE